MPSLNALSQAPGRPRCLGGYPVVVLGVPIETCWVVLLWLVWASVAAADETLQTLRSGWESPARTYRPHTRWWWPGNALTKADITFQLAQMAGQGMGGVEIMSAFTMYEKGNHEFLSPEHLDLMKFAVAEGRRLDMEVAITFGPGWSFGGPWVSPEDQSKVLCMASLDVNGGSRFIGKLPVPQPVKLSRDSVVTDHGALIAVVAAKICGDQRLEGESLTVLTPKIQPEADRLEWLVPPGDWRLMAFWLKRTGQENQAYSGPKSSMVIDHLNRGAVQRYCDHLGNVLDRNLGDALPAGHHPRRARREKQAGGARDRRAGELRRRHEVAAGSAGRIAVAARHGQSEDLSAQQCGRQRHGSKRVAAVRSDGAGADCLAD